MSVDDPRPVLLPQPPQLEENQLPQSPAMLLGVERRRAFEQRSASPTRLHKTSTAQKMENVGIGRLSPDTGTATDKQHSAVAAPAEEPEAAVSAAAHREAAAGTLETGKVSRTEQSQNNTDAPMIFLAKTRQANREKKQVNVN